MRWMIALFGVLLGGCGSPSAGDIQTAIAQTQDAVAPTLEIIAQATRTPRPSPTPRPTATAVPSMGTRSEPYRLGQTAVLTQAGTIEFEATLVEVIRGQEAWERVLSANMFNEAAPAGSEYLIALVSVVYTGADTGVLDLGEADWSLISEGRISKYFDLPVNVCCMEPAFDMQLFSGGSGEGWLAWIVPIGEAEPLLAIGLDPDGSGGIFFSTLP